MQKQAVAKICDLTAVMPPMVLNCLGIGALYLQLSLVGVQLREGFRFDHALNFASRSAMLAFMALQVVLFAIRRPPEGKARGPLPRLAAILGSNIPVLFLVLPRAPESTPLLALSTLFMVAGLTASIYVGAVLGRSFSVFPQARGLTVTGPYGFIRHPLYIAEQIAVFGIMCQYAQPLAFLLMLASLVAQIPRIHFEEQVLSETYPAYRLYMMLTPRFIPRISAPRVLPASSSCGRLVCADSSGR